MFVTVSNSLHAMWGVPRHDRTIGLLNHCMSAVHASTGSASGTAYCIRLNSRPNMDRGIPILKPIKCA